jgi:hypothetical protein
MLAVYQLKQSADVYQMCTSCNSCISAATERMLAEQKLYVSCNRGISAATERMLAEQKLSSLTAYVC